MNKNIFAKLLPLGAILTTFVLGIFVSSINVTPANALERGFYFPTYKFDKDNCSQKKTGNDENVKVVGGSYLCGDQKTKFTVSPTVCKLKAAWVNEIITNCRPFNEFIPACTSGITPGSANFSHGACGKDMVKRITFTCNGQPRYVKDKHKIEKGCQTREAYTQEANSYCKNTFRCN